MPSKIQKTIKISITFYVCLKNAQSEISNININQFQKNNQNLKIKNVYLTKHYFLNNC